MRLAGGWILVASLAVFADSAGADARDAVFGLWATEEAILQVAPAGESLSAKLVALMDPTYHKGEEALGAPGTPRVDAVNPDPALRNRPMLGLELLSGYAFEKGRWRGKIYDPESGKTYSSNGGARRNRLRLATLAPPSRCWVRVVLNRGRRPARSRATTRGAVCANP